LQNGIISNLSKAEFAYKEYNVFVSNVIEIMKKNMPQPVLWEKKDKNCVQCHICYNECIIPPGSVSRCFSRKNENGEMLLNNFGFISSIAADPIEKKPLYHFHPGTKVLSVGGWGCNFSCLHCQNWNISQPDLKEADFTLFNKFLSPEELVSLIEPNDCKGLAWTYNEPAIWLEYTLESAKLAKEKGFYTVYVTNGFMTIPALEMIAPYLDAYRVDLKSFEEKFYRQICKVKNWQGIFDTAKRAKELGLHIEAVTNIIPTKNDSDENLKNLALWIAENLGVNTPWHVTRFFPCNKLLDLPPTPLETIEKAELVGKEAGLNFVYRGNIAGKADTVCPECKTFAVRRDYTVETNLDKKGCCAKCGHDLNIRV